MAAGEEDSQDSLSQEEAFLAETAQFTKFVVQLHYQLKQSKEIIVQGTQLLNIELVLLYPQVRASLSLRFTRGGFTLHLSVRQSANQLANSK